MKESRAIQLLSNANKTRHARWFLKRILSKGLEKILEFDLHGLYSFLSNGRFVRDSPCCQVQREQDLALSHAYG